MKTSGMLVCHICGKGVAWTAEDTKFVPWTGWVDAFIKDHKKCKSVRRKKADDQ